MSRAGPPAPGRPQPKLPAAPRAPVKEFCPECPVDAIKPDTEPGLEKWLEINTEYAKQWPNITVKRDPPADSKEYEGMPGKFEKFFSPKPGTGD